MMKNSDKTTRREFITKTGMLTTGLALGAYPMTAKSSILGANDRERNDLWKAGEYVLLPHPRSVSYNEGNFVLKNGGFIWLDKEQFEDLFITAPKLKEKYGRDFEKIPPGAIGVYTYVDRLTQGLQQLMAGERKFALQHITRDDIFALTREAAEMSGIAYVMDVDKEAVDKILG